MRRRLNVCLIISLILFLGVLPNCQDRNKDQSRIEASGVIEAVETEIKSQIQGEVRQIAVTEGQYINKGDLLCLLDNEKLHIRLNQVRAALEGAKLKLKLFQKGTKKELIAVAKNQLESAEEELGLAKKDQERMSKLFSEGAISQIQKEQADLRLKVSKDRYESAQENYQLALRGKEEEEIEMVRAELKSLQAQEQLLLRQIQDSEIRSPINGYLNIKHVEVGELALPGVTLFSLIDLTQTYVKTYVPERHIGRIKIGDRVEVVSDSFPEKVFHGVINYISDKAEFAPKDIQTKEERLKLVFMIKSYLDNSNRELKPGMPVDVRIITRDSV
ncbi:MAG: HlyD family efflux transporter periplasmic adaptor subunit [Candidatus Aminicenantes bacterium]|nr:HlyD family efflux transporter periplasmic adaptor subunit [Candidatus Aminicenantes bacterium]